MAAICRIVAVHRIVKVVNPRLSRMTMIEVCREEVPRSVPSLSNDAGNQTGQRPEIQAGRSGRFLAAGGPDRRGHNSWTSGFILPDVS